MRHATNAEQGVLLTSMHGIVATATTSPTVANGYVDPAPAGTA